jgi:hypothetical protein
MSGAGVSQRCAVWALTLACVCGCSARALTPRAARAVAAPAAADAASPAPPADAAPADVAPPGDVAVDVAAPPPELAFQRFVAAWDRLIRARYVECFGVPADVIADWRFTTLWSGGDDLRAGLKELDLAAVDVCLSTMANATCDEIAAGALEIACKKPFEGLVPPGGFCVEDDDCAGAGMACNRDGVGRCSSRCAAVSSTSPASLPAEGERCDGDGCAPGLYCRWDGPRTIDGVCAAAAAGGACDGSWNCPSLYTCVFDDAGRGTCGVGLAPGAPCRLYAFDAFNGPKTDCAEGLYCYPDAAGAFRCQKGQALGEPCRRVPPPVAGENEGPMPCRGGSCDPTARVCVPYHADGAACAAEWECGPDASCDQHVCRSSLDPPVPEGGACYEWSRCAAGLYCWPDDLESGSSSGSCRPPIADGQPCERGCGPLSDCVSGLCTACE